MVIVVPVFMMMQKMGLYNTYTGVILTILATSMAFPILLMRSFFDSVPFAMEEAAAIDGCSRFMALIRVIIPMTLPGIPLKETEARDLLEIVESRYKRNSTIFCSQFDIPGWPEKLSDPLLADAICDRIVHDAYTVVIGGKESMRKRKGLQDI